MKSILFLIFFVFTGFSAQAADPSFLTPLAADSRQIATDIQDILRKGELPPDLIELQWKERLGKNPASLSSARIQCSAQRIQIQVRSVPQERAAVTYLALQKMGFLFPHPRWQITPSRMEIQKQCGKTVHWEPRFKFRGFHLHTQHPNEWVSGFMGTNPEIGRDYIRWLARNNQNVLQVKLLKTSRSELKKNLQPLLLEARRFGILTGIDVSFSSFQQKSFRLLDVHYFLALLSGTFGWFDHEVILSTLKSLQQDLTFDYLSTDLGTSEFTSTNFERTLEWIEVARKHLAKSKQGLFVKNHVSMGQTHPKYGNFNYLAQYSSKGVGVQAHSVMPYSLLDPQVPVYGRKDLADMRSFIESQNPVRPLWYFPETSYWVAVDIDIPLFLTDYLLARSVDMDYVQGVGVPGHVTFTSGQEMGSWLFDWTVALLSNSENKKNPFIGLKLLGEDTNEWKKIASFQEKYFKQKGLLSILSSANLMDEMPFFSASRILGRLTMKELRERPARLKEEINLLLEAKKNLPSLAGLRNPELKTLIQITWMRLNHALEVRLSLSSKIEKAPWRLAMQEASAIRLKVLSMMKSFIKSYERYPEARVFDWHPNPTSYSFGYAWPAKTLHFWEREEEVVRNDVMNPFFMNIYNPLDLIF